MEQITTSHLDAALQEWRELRVLRDNMAKMIAQEPTEHRLFLHRHAVSRVEAAWGRYEELYQARALQQKTAREADLAWAAGWE